MSKISYIIRTYNEVKHLGNLLDSLKFQTLKDYEVIIVDSGSDDGTLKIAKQEDCIVKKIKKSDFTFGKSLNIGCETAKNEILIICSAHILPIEKNWAEKLVEPLKLEKVAMTYGSQRGVESSYFSEKQIFLEYFPENESNKIKDFANNANSAIKKSIWKKIKFDEKLTGLEDIYYAKTLIKKNYFVKYVKEAGIYHIHNETPMQIKWRFEREAIALKKIYNNLNPRYRNILSFFLSSLISDMKALLKYKNFSLKKFLSIFVYRFFQCYGIFCSKTEDQITPEKFKMFYYPNKK